MSATPQKELTAIWNKVTTSSDQCLVWIEKGAMQLMNFNHTEAILNFRKALSFDNDCAMAHYFIAYCNAGNYNNLLGFDYAIGWEESQKAFTMAGNLSLTDWESALIEAQVHRFCSPVGSIANDTLNKNYANKMRLVYQKFEDHVEVAVFFAESLMNLAPWKLWTSLPNIKPAIPETEELTNVLEKALKLAPNHPGLCHLYIHTMELSPTPEKALPAADVLRSHTVEHGHLVHMASHIDIWVGNYNEAIEVNKRAIQLDKEFLIKREGGVDFYNFYFLHNYHFLVWGAMLNGRYTTALKYAEEIKLHTGPEVIQNMLGNLPIGIIFGEAIASIDWHVLVRFGKWEDIIKRPIEKNKDMYPSSVVMARYARGVAFAALGRIAEAEKERELFYEVRKDKTFAKRCQMNNFMYNQEKPGRGILDIAEAVLNGEIEYRKGNFEEAFRQLRLAVERDCHLVYSEPWSWMMPTRHVLGALLLEHGNVAEAEAVYREDLSQYKNNMWSLLGLHQTLKEQKRVEEADSVLGLFHKASALAEIKIGASCLCATQISS